MPRLALATLTVFAALMSTAADDPDIPVPGDPKCFVTNIGAKCCNDVVLSWVQCGDQQCNTLEEVCDNLKSCAETTVGGFKECTLEWCYKRIITRVCVEGNQCNLVGPPAYEEIVQGQKASGAQCPAKPQ